MDFTTLIDAASLRSLIGEPHIVVLDCRFELAAPEAGRQAYLRQHIPTARYLDLNRDLSSPVTPTSGRHPLPVPERLAALFGELGIGAATQVIAYDESNSSFAARAWWLLKWLGHDKTAVLDGGMRAWIAAGGPFETGDARQSRPASESAGRERFRARHNPRSAIGTDELVRALKDPKVLLVDARAPERFTGTVEPIDAVAGHIPGAVNHPFTLNLEADGRFLPADELKRRWQARLGGIHPADAIAMCGSGVTACHNLLALELASLPGARLYAGSWSEWVRDPERPVARA